MTSHYFLAMTPILQKFQCHFLHMQLSIHFVKFCALRLDEQCLSSGVVISDGSRGVSTVSTVSIETPFSEENLLLASYSLTSP